jgi:superfamily II DNA or RNA helicase
MTIHEISGKDSSSETGPYGKFKFPFKPYAIQEDFMNALYDTIDKSKVGIFESPTGTVCRQFGSFERNLELETYTGQ